MQINSLYSNKEIFLRELISNASDALDKVRFVSLTDEDAMATHADEPSVWIKADKEAGTLTITDNGIGMTKEDLVNNLGTLAKSGTKGFLEAATEQQQAGGDGDVSSSLIGQFGVGFYSAFLVADTVEVTSKNNKDSKQWVWISGIDGLDSFKVYEDPEGVTLGRGTQISIKLKDDSQEYLEAKRLNDLVKKYSSFINFPIYLWSSKDVEVEVPVEDEEKDAEADTETGEDVDIKDVEDEDEDDSPKTKTITETQWDWERVNSARPVWMRPPKEVSDEDYTNFYNSFTGDSAEPLTHIHFVAEGEVEFRSILFTPSKAPYDLFDSSRANDNVKLYVRRVFIKDENLDLLPRYLAFVRGVVDSNDLPLNVSREMLQQSKTLKVIRKKLTRKALEAFKHLADDEDKSKYETFWKEFGKSIKLGMIEDTANKTKLSKLLRFQSSQTEEDEFTSLDDYVTRMKDDQESIYFLGGSSRAECEASPYLERLVARGYEVLFFVDAIDEYAAQTLTEYESHKLVGISKEDLIVGDEAAMQRRKERDQASFQTLIDYAKETLGKKVKDVTVSQRLHETPAIVVTGKYGYTPNMERISNAQALQSGNRGTSSAQKTLEINPRHPVIKALKEQVEDGATEQTAQYLNLLLDSALVGAGFPIDDTTEFAKRMNYVMRTGLHVDMYAEIEEEPLDEDVDDVVAEEEEEEDYSDHGDDL